LTWIAEGDTVAGALLGLELEISNGLATGVVFDPLMQSAVLVGTLATFLLTGKVPRKQIQVEEEATFLYRTNPPTIY
jgi:hypothetical protein